MKTMIDKSVIIDDAPKNITDDIKKIRRRIGYDALSALVGRSRRTIEGWEAGRRPNVTALKILSRLSK